MKSSSKALFRVGLSLALIAWLIGQVGASDLLENLKKLSPSFILFAWLYYAFCQVVSAYRWQLFLSAKGVHVPIQKLFSFYMVGMFLNNFMPGAVGGDVVKSIDLYKHTRDGHLATVSVFLERFTGLIGLSIISIVALVIGFQRLQSPIILIAVGGTALFLISAVALFWYPPISAMIRRLPGKLLPKKISSTIEKTYDALTDYRKHPSTLVVTILLSVIVQILFALYYALTSRALGIPVPTELFILFLPLVTLVTMVPISIGGLGIREWLMIVLFESVGVASTDILTISLTVHVVNTVLSLWGGLILLCRKAQPATVEPEPTDA